ncbi:hypothetical protein EMIT0373P_11645 [Pseudomonas chlororaphis]
MHVHPVVDAGVQRHAENPPVLLAQRFWPDRVMRAQVADEPCQQEVGIHHPEHQQLEGQGWQQPVPHPDRRFAPSGRAFHWPEHEERAGDYDEYPGGEEGAQHSGAEGASHAVFSPEARDENDPALVGNI